MNRLQASLSAAAALSFFLVSSSALADEEPATNEPTPAVVEEEKPATETAEQTPAPTSDIAFVSSPSPSPVDADSIVAPRTAGDRMRVGALVGVGFPRPLSVAAFVKVNRVIGVGAEYGFLPKTSISGAEIEIKSAAADLKVFPFKNSFFVGLRGGRQWVDGSASATVGPQSGSASMSASTWFINPRVGILHTFENGVTLGIDGGVQIPIAPELATEYSNPAIAKTSAPNAMKSVANLLGNETTPTIDLLRVGFLF